MTSSEREPANACAAAQGAAASASLAAVSRLGVTHEGAPAATPHDVSFSVVPGEVVLVLGPSGSGKSTLALTLNGLIPHAVPATTTGEVRIAGMDAATTPVSQLSVHVGMVFQDPDAQLVTGSLRDEVAFGPENLLRPLEEVLASSEKALRRMGLWERRDENPDRLSGGGRQRLAIAAALAMGSPLLVLDEPTANLDPQGIEDVYEALRDLAADGTERAIILIEHNLDAAIDFTTRVIVLDHDGCLVADGTVDQVLRERAGELHALGVWLPTSATAALRLRRGGYDLDPLPLTPTELHAALEVSPPPSARHARGGDVAHETRSEATPATLNATPHAISAVNLRLKRGRTEILHGIDLEIPQGDFVAIVGANGAGKTTLLQALAGVIAPPRDSVFLGENRRDVARLSRRAIADHIGFVFQNPEHQFIAHTVFDELAHGLRRAGLDETDVRSRVDEILERFGLTGKADTHPFLLSGGQKRRLSVGTALVTGAPILALDEPTFGQDRARADELLDLLTSLNHGGTTIIIVTHDMQLVTEYAHHTIVLHDGVVQHDGSTATIFADSELLTAAGLRVPPLRRALQGVRRHPTLAATTRLADLPGGAPW